MKIFNYKSSLEVDEIINKFKKYEDDIPNAFNPFALYYNSRIGLHIKIKNNKIVGYYEDGRVHPTRGSLYGAKTYFWACVRPNNFGIEIKGIAIHSPAWLLGMFLPLLMTFFERDIFNLLGCILIITIYILFYREHILNDQLAICRIIKEICDN